MAKKTLAELKSAKERVNAQSRAELKNARLRVKYYRLIGDKANLAIALGELAELQDKWSCTR